MRSKYVQLSHKARPQNFKEHISRIKWYIRYTDIYIYGTILLLVVQAVACKEFAATHLVCH